MSDCVQNCYHKRFCIDPCYNWKFSNGGYALCESFERLILAEKVGEIKSALDEVSQHIINGKISLWDIMRIARIENYGFKTLSEVLMEKFRMLPQNAIDLHVSILETGQRLDSIITNGRSEMLSALCKRKRIFEHLGNADADVQQIRNLIVGNKYNGYPMPTVQCNTCGTAIVQYFPWRYEDIHKETCAEICAEIGRRKRVLAEKRKELTDCVRKQLVKKLSNFYKKSSEKPAKKSRN